MKRDLGRYALLLGAAFILMGCASGISKEAKSRVTYTGPFNDVQKQPEKFKGETVIWGGKVIDTHTEAEATEIVVLQLGLGHRHRPQDNDQSMGRFIIRSRQFLDPALYPKGTLVTVVGPVAGTEMRSIGEMDYNYPVIEVAEIKKWHPVRDASPRLHFGIGIGKQF